MSKTPLNATIVSSGGTSTYAIPAGQYAVYNIQQVWPVVPNNPSTIPGGGIYYINTIVGYNIIWSIASPASIPLRMGPFVSNAGDVIGVLPFDTNVQGGVPGGPNPAGSSVFNPAANTLSGWLFTPSLIKSPVTVLLNNTTTYTVPAGKYFIGHTFSVVGTYGVYETVVSGVTVCTSLSNKAGPFTAGPGQVISVIQWPFVPAQTYPPACLLNGFLHNV
jgi:hypothetical protein